MNDSYEQSAEFFKALAHPIRLQILDILRAGEVCVCHIEATLQKRQAYISQQLMMLRETGLVLSRREGGRIYYRLADERLYRLLDVMFSHPHPSAIEIIEDCPCPKCQETPISTISIS